MSKSSNTDFADGVGGILLFIAAIIAIVVVGFIALWVLGIVLFLIVLYLLPLTLPGLFLGYLMAGFAKASALNTGNEYAPRVNTVAPIITFSVIVGLFILVVGLPESHTVRFDEKTNGKWAEIQWPSLVDTIGSAKTTLKLDGDEKRKFRVSDLNENGDYFTPKPKAKKGKDKPKARSQKLADDYGPQPPPGFFLTEDQSIEAARQIHEIKLTGPNGEDGVPYDAQLLKLLLCLSLFIGAPGVFLFFMNAYLEEENKLALNRVDAFLEAEKTKRDDLLSDLKNEKLASKEALAKKDKEIKILEARIADMAKLNLEMTQTLIPGAAAAAGQRPSGYDSTQKKEDSALVKPKGALGSDFL